MPMPETISAEDLARWDQTFADYTAEQPGFTGLLGAGPMKERGWYPGEWLGEQLLALGCPHDEMERLCTAAGQRIWASPDAWEVVKQALEAYRAGKPNHRTPIMSISGGTMRVVATGCEDE